MPGVSRTSQDSAGGTITGVLVPTVAVNGTPVAVISAAVAPHGFGVHGGPVMAQGSGTVFAGGIPVCRAGDAASCGHAATGSSNVFAGD
ncbi:PAAR domain-containing protein [Leisingera sp. MMG026]|uniref:PAAR domain-containing protein n=1 Tax=Leisingera sp. MMG026 TaxID=2909982 RepID=UPI001F2BC99D|nr:PAAR domain-containing protein [Leisingera sp. MMG026]MCF6432910.1 PAAR domain-containing protein [Leisingera sp. MMG026]